MTHGNPPHSYPDVLAKKHPTWRVVSRGIGGVRTEQVLGTVEDMLIAQRPDVVIVLAGINDLTKNKTAEHAKKHLHLIYEQVRGSGARVMACTVMPTQVFGPEIGAGIEDINAWVRDYSGKENLGLCDLAKIMQDPANPQETRQTTDGVHFTDEGYDNLGLAVDACLEKWLGAATK